MTPIEVRSQLVTALQLDLVGPHDGIGNDAEILPQHPSRWYLTGFLVPFDAGESQASDVDAGDDIDGAGERGGTDDQTPRQSRSKQNAFPVLDGIESSATNRNETIAGHGRLGRLCSDRANG